MVAPHLPRTSPVADADAAPRAAARPGWIYLVGAGPGADDLLTRRGAALLATADLVVHSEPLAPALRALIRSGAQQRSLGPRGAKGADHRRFHDALAADLVVAARQGLRVVRLHGGDPLLFSRGVQLAEALGRAAVPFEIVPGVGSPLAAAAGAGVPLTHPELASSVTLLSPTGQDGAGFDWSELRGLSGTLCVLKAARRLEEICQGLQQHAGVPADRPAAAVQHAGDSAQRTIVGTVGDIAQRAAAAELSPPALLVVGPVVRLRSTLAWLERKPLFGVRILLTRPAHQATGTAVLLRSRGAEVISVPTIAIEAPPDPERLTAAAGDLGSYDLVLLTSANGVARLWDELDRKGLDARTFGSAAVGAIGPGTAAALHARGIRPDIVPERFVAEALVEAVRDRFGARLQGLRLLLVRALQAREVLPDRLREAGAQVDVIAAYQTLPASADRADELRAHLERDEIDVVLLSSSSTVDQLVGLLGDDAKRLLASPLLASIGPITTATLETHGLQAGVTAERSTMEGLIDAVEAALPLRGTERPSAPEAEQEDRKTGIRAGE